MKRIVVFHSVGHSALVFAQVERDANAWLLLNPGVKLLTSHTAMASHPEWTEFAITLIVEAPITEQEAGALEGALTGMRSEASSCEEQRMMSYS